jgi:hypothetical protein
LQLIFGNIWNSIRLGPAYLVLIVILQLKTLLYQLLNLSLTKEKKKLKTINAKIGLR